MTRVGRFDRGTLRGAERTDAGFLRADAALTRVGVFRYRLADGTERRELRPPDEVMKAVSLATMRGVPVTDGHPRDFVTADNARTLGRGHVGEDVREDRGMVAATLTVEDGDLIRKIEGGLREISSGYTAMCDETAGTFNGERYDAIQRDIRYNHVAFVDKGRAGPAVRLRVDSQDAEQITDTETPPESTGGDTEGTKMPTIKIDGVDFECPEQLKQVLETREAKRDAIGKAAADEKAELDSKVSELDGKVKALESEVSTEKTRADAAEAPAAVSKRVRERLALVQQADRWLDESAKVDEMTDTEILRAIVKAAEPEIKVDDADEAAVRGMFAVISKRETPKEKVAKQRGDTRTNDDGADKSPDARADARDSQRKAHQSKYGRTQLAS